MIVFFSYLNIVNQGLSGVHCFSFFGLGCSWWFLNKSWLIYMFLFQPKNLNRKRKGPELAEEKDVHKTYNRIRVMDLKKLFSTPFHLLRHAYSDVFQFLVNTCIWAITFESLMNLHTPIFRFQAVTAKGTFTSTIIGDGQTEQFNTQSTMHRLVRIRFCLCFLYIIFAKRKHCLF